MMELALFAIGILLIVFTWSYMWQRTMLDFTRDRLFDLRDGVLKSHFLTHHNLEHQAYIGLRDLINRHLRVTESLSFPGFIIAVALIERRSLAKHEISALIDNRLLTQDPDLRQFIAFVREKAALIMLQHMVTTSVLSVGLLIFTLPAKLIQSFIKHVTTKVDQSLSDSAKEAVDQVGKSIIQEPQRAFEGLASAAPWDCPASV